MYVTNDKHRKQLTRFRVSSHNLEIEAGRYNQLNRNDRICKICNMNVPETKFHFLLCCPVYRNLRIQFLGNIRWPTLQQFKNIMSTKSKSKIFNVTKYIMNAYQLRNEYLVSID